MATDEARRWTLLILFLAFWGNVLRTSRFGAESLLPMAANTILESGAFTVAGWVMIAAWSGRLGGRHRAPRRFLAASLAIAVLAAVPDRQACLLAMAALAAWLFTARSFHDRAVAALLAAMALGLAWTSSYVMPLHDACARLDARLVQALLGTAGIPALVSGNLVANPARGFSIEILALCSASYPLAGVCLAYLEVCLFLGRLPARRDLPFLAASLLASVMLTECRLSWMALRERDYFWLHDGGGKPLYTLAATGLAVLFPWLASRPPRPAPVIAS